MKQEMFASVGILIALLEDEERAIKSYTQVQCLVKDVDLISFLAEVWSV